MLLFKQNLDLAIRETSSEVSEIKMTVEIQSDCWNIQNAPYHNVNWPSGEGLKARFLDLIILSPGCWKHPILLFLFWCDLGRIPVVYVSR